MCLPKRTIIALTTEPPNVINALNCKVLLIVFLEVVSSPSNAQISLPNTKENNLEEVSPVSYKPAVDGKTPTSQKSFVHNNDTNRLAPDWCNKVEIFEPYSAHRAELMAMVSKF